MKRKLTVIAFAFVSLLMTSCLIDGGSSAKDDGSAKDEKITTLEQEIDSIRRNPTVVRDTVKVREKIESSAELTDEAKQLLNDIAE